MRLRAALAEEERRAFSNGSERRNAASRERREKEKRKKREEKRRRRRRAEGECLVHVLIHRQPSTSVPFPPPRPPPRVFPTAASGIMCARCALCVCWPRVLLDGRRQRLSAAIARRPRDAFSLASLPSLPSPLRIAPAVYKAGRGSAHCLAKLALVIWTSPCCPQAQLARCWIRRAAERGAEEQRARTWSTAGHSTRQPWGGKAHPGGLLFTEMR